MNFVHTVGRRCCAAGRAAARPYQWISRITRKGKRGKVLIGGGEAKDVTNFGANLAAAFQADAAAFFKKRARVHQIHPRAIAESLPIKPVSAVEEDLLGAGLAALGL